MLHRLASRRYDNNKAFRNSAKGLPCIFGSNIQTMEGEMTTPTILRCPDGHYHRVIFGLGAYIADYPEQFTLSGVVSDWCPKYTVFV